MKNFVLAASLALSSTAFCSALIEKNDSTKELKVISRMVYSGSALTDALAAASTDEIDRMWNEFSTTVSINGQNYRVSFEIDYAMPGQTLRNRASCAHNFIEIINLSRPGDRSYYRGLGSQYGAFYTSDELGISTTAAHEYGHGLYLDHDGTNQIPQSIPGIMFARGTWVKPEFQWDPAALPGMPGGTLKPHHRRVRPQDIKKIPFSKVIFNVQGLGCLGDGQALDIR